LFKQAIEALNEFANVVEVQACGGPIEDEETIF
jgi:hypothetical protein